MENSRFNWVFLNVGLPKAPEMAKDIEDDVSIRPGTVKAPEMAGDVKDYVSIRPALSRHQRWLGMLRTSWRKGV